MINPSDLGKTLHPGFSKWVVNKSGLFSGLTKKGQIRKIFLKIEKKKKEVVIVK